MCLFNFRGRGCTLSDRLDGGVPHPRSGQGVPPSQILTGVSQGTLIQVRTGGTLGYPLPHPRLDRIPLLPDWMGYPLSRTGLGSPPPRPRLDGVPPPSRQKTGQHSEHLLRAGRRASCVHAGGLYNSVFPLHSMSTFIMNPK